MTDRTAPKCQLRLEWVYGYRGNKVRSNLFYDLKNQAVYFVAGVAIVYNLKDKRQKFFLGHDDDIISLTTFDNKTDAKTLVATGQVGKSPQILVWDTDKLEIVSILKGDLKDGIGILAFDQDGKRLVSCSIDQDSTITIWDWRKAKVIAKTSIHQDKVFDVKFNPGKDNMLVSCGVKHINFWKLTGNTLEKKKGIFGQLKAIQTMFCVAFAKADDVVYTGTTSGDVYVWKGQNLEEIVSSAHDGPIYSMITSPDGYITSGKDGKVRFWDAKFAPTISWDLKENISECDDLTIRSISWNGSSLLVGTEACDIFEATIDGQGHIDYKPICRSHAEGELWALSVSPINPDVFATASDDETVRIWDMKSKSLKQIKKLDQKVKSCSFSSNEQHLACGLEDGTLVILDMKNDLNEIHRKKIRSEKLHEMKYSPCGKYLAVGSNENEIDIFDSGSFKKLGTCKGHTSSITHLDWSADSLYIRTNSQAAKDGVLYYKAPKGTLVPTSGETKKITNWATFTGVLGDEVVGIWEKYTDKTDVNSTDANFDEQCMVTGDDFGLVKLFRFPSLKKGAKYKKYVGHSSHVTNVRFNSDKTRVITIGGLDHAVLQWRFISEDLVDAVNISTSKDQVLQNTSANQFTADVPELPAAYDAYLDSDSEYSDSEASNRDIDSDVEKEKEISYERNVYKDDLQVLKPKIKEEIKSAETDLGEKRQARPEVSLSLKSVYGYRGYDCRDNLFYLQFNGLLVYHVAALGIVYSKETNKQSFYDKHSDDILCLCVYTNEKRQSFVATGQIGRDPPIHVWEADTLKTISILKGQHSRGICSMSFSNDGKKLASVGLDDYHMICVWNWRKGEVLATTRGSQDKIFSIKWNPHDSDKLTTVGVKHMKFWNQIAGGFTSHRGLFKSKVENILCVVYGKSADICYTGSGSGSVFHWKGQSIEKKIEKAHDGSIHSIYALDRWEGYITGGKDGCIVLWNDQFTNQLKKYTIDKASKLKGVLFEDKPSIRSICLANTFKKIIVGTNKGEIIDIDRDGSMEILFQGHAEGELWGLACHPNKQEFCTASDDKSLRIWDLNSRTMKKLKTFNKAARSCEYSPDGKYIAIGMADGSAYVVKADTLEDLKIINNRHREISDVRFSPIENKGKYLAVASHDQFIDIYHVENKKLIGTCKGSSSYISHIDWDIEGRLLMVNTGARELLFFEVPSCNRVNINANEVFSVKWDTISGGLGLNLTGIWPPCTDITDVNSTCLLSSDNVLATGDDFGFVKLFNYPCTGKFSKFKQYSGHSAHVTRVRWTQDGTQLISIGGGDTAILVWDYSPGSVATSRSIQRSNESIQNIGRGESEDSATDSEDEGYDSDVKREKNINYFQSIFVNPMKRANANAIKTVQTETGHNNAYKSNRTSSNKFKQTKVKKKAEKEDSESVNEEGEQGNVMQLMAARMKFISNLPSEAKKQTEIKELKLNHVLGYRGIDGRDNLFYLDDESKIVFYSAGAGIVMDLNTNTQSFYLEHTDDIISLAVNRNPKFKNVIATGQIGTVPLIRVWDASTLETLTVLSGLHKNGICSLDFSSSGRYLVSVGLDLNYTIGVWRWKEGTLAASHAGDLSEHRIFRASFRPDSDTVFVSVGFKHLRFWTVCGSELVSKKAVLTDLSSSNGQKQQQRKMPTMLSLAFHPNKILFGTKSNEIFEINEKTLSTSRLLSGHKESAIWGLAVHPSKDIFATTSYDGYLKVWNMSKKSLMGSHELKKPIRCVDFDPDGVYLAIGFVDGEIMMVKCNPDYTKFEMTDKYRQRSSCITDIKFSPDNKFVVTGSDDSSIDFFKFTPSQNGKIAKIGYSAQTPGSIIQIDWSNNSKYIRIGITNCQNIVYSVPDDKPCAHIKDKNILDNIVWDEWSSIFGEELAGVWTTGNGNKNDKTINCSHLATHAKILATGDDNGLVKLFPFPCTQKDPEHHLVYYGHSSNIANIKFSCNNTYLISTGGEDYSIFIWQCS